jgi:hypothetical protein
MEVDVWMETETRTLDDTQTLQLHTRADRPLALRARVCA